MAYFGAFSAVFIVRVLARKMLNFPPEVVIWWTLKMHFWEVPKLWVGKFFTTL